MRLALGFSMRLSWLSSNPVFRPLCPQAWQQKLCRGLAIAVLCLGLLLGQSSPAHASLNDDSFDGNIFALYAGNGSLVPPRVTLADSRDGLGNLRRSEVAERSLSRNSW